MLAVLVTPCSEAFVGDAEHSALVPLRRGQAGPRDFWMLFF